MSDMPETTATGREGQETEETTPTTETGAEGGTPQAETKTPDELAALRAQLKTANDESAARRHKIKELEDQITAASRKDMDEVDRLKAELADLKGASQARDELSARIERYETVIQSQVDQLLKELKVPDYITTLLESKTPADKLDYLLANRDKLQPAEKRKPDFEADRKGSGKQLSDKEKEARQTALRQRMRLRRR